MFVCPSESESASYLLPGSPSLSLSLLPTDPEFTIGHSLGSSPFVSFRLVSNKLQLLGRVQHANKTKQNKTQNNSPEIRLLSTADHTSSQLAANCFCVVVCTSWWTFIRRLSSYNTLSDPSGTASSSSSYLTFSSWLETFDRVSANIVTIC